MRDSHPAPFFSFGTCHPYRLAVTRRPFRESRYLRPAARYARSVTVSTGGGSLVIANRYE